MPYSRPHIIALYLLFLLLGPQVFQASAQDDFESIEDLKDKAEELFEEKKFLEAMPLYSQLLSQKPKDPIYNYKYGVCALHGKAETKTPIKHLSYSAKKEEVPAPVHYYLGRAYHSDYRFDKAIKAYRKFKEEGDPDELPVERDLRMARNGKDLMEKADELVVLDRTQTGTEEFFRYYEPEGVKGKILVAPEEIMNEADKERGTRSIIFFPSGSNTIFYASYGEDGESGKDIYQVKQLPNGEWAKPQKLRGEVNTEFDEDYPFKPPNSRNLYFCSKGHNSMGGYDIFRSEYDEKTGTYGPPENLDFPINSPDDDIFYLADEEERKAYFASGRSSDAEHLHVYKVRIEKIPMQTKILKGKFHNELDTSELKARITVKDARTGKKVGVYNSSKENGDYLITVPKSGEYEFIVNPSSSEQEYKGTVKVPKLEELRPLKQALVLTEKNGKVRLLIKNKFDERFENEKAILSQVMKEKGELKENDSKEMREKLKEAREKGSDSLASEEELIAEAEERAEKLEKESEELEDRQEEAYGIADEEQKEAEKIREKAQSSLEEAESAEDEETRDRKLEEADSLQQEASKKSQRAKSAIELADELGEKAKKKRKAAEKANEYAQKLEKGLNKGEKREVLKNLENKKKAIDRAAEGSGTGRNALSSIQEEADEMEKKADRALDRGQAKRSQARDIEERITSLDRRIPSASGDEKKELKTERDSLRKELQKVRAEGDSAFAKADRIQERADRKKARAELLKDLQEKESSSKASEKGKSLSKAEKKELQQAVSETEKKTRQQGEDPLLVQHRKQKGSKGGKSEELKTGRDADSGRRESDRSYEKDRKSFQYEESDPVVQKVIDKHAPDHRSSIQTIESDEDLSDAEKRKRILDRKEKLAQTLDQRIEKREQELRASSDPEEKEKKRDELQKLREARRTLGQELDRKGRETSEAASRKSGAEEEKRQQQGDRSGYRIEEQEASTQNALREIDPSYEEDISSIRNDASLSSSEKEDRIEEREKELLERIDQAIEKKEDQLEEIEGSEEKDRVRKKLESLRAARSELQGEDEDKGERIASDSKEGDDTGGEEEKLGAEERSGTKSDLDKEERELLQAKAPSYREDIRAIESSDRGRAEKDLERARRTEELVDRLQDSIAEKRKALSQKSEPDELKSTSKELEKLRSIRDKKEKEAKRYRARAAGDEPISRRTGERDNKKRTANERKRLSEQEVDRTIASVDPSYREDLKEIQRSSEPGTRSYFDQKAEREKKALEETRSSIDSLRSALAQSKDDQERERLYDRISKLKKVEERSEARQKSYRAYRKGADQEKKATSSVSQKLEKDLSAIEASDMGAQERAELKKERKRKAIQELNRRIAQEERIRASGSSEVKSQAKERIQELKAYRKELRKELKEEKGISKEGSSEQKKEEEALARAERMLAKERDESSERENSERDVKDPEKERAEQRARRSESYAASQRAKASELLSGNEGKDDDPDPSERAKALQLQHRADSAERMAQAFQSLAEDQGTEKEEDEKVGGEVLAKGSEQEGGAKNESGSGSGRAKEGDAKNRGQENEDRGDSEEQGPEKGSKKNGGNNNGGVGEGRDDSETRTEGSESEENETDDSEIGGDQSEEGKSEDRTDRSTESGTEGSEDEEVSGSVLRVEDPKEALQEQDQVFQETEGTPYSQENPIPEDPDMPEGVIYQVQVGAFSQPLPQDHFKGFAPLIAKTGEDGITRYRAGFFEQLDNAEEARDRIREKGYQDAFVVAYEGGEWIPISEAERETSEEAVAEGRSQGQGAESRSDREKSSSDRSGAAAEASIEDIKGLFYTVQVGVYSDLLQEKGPLKGISPLYVKRTSSGNYRYSTGIFSSVEKARSKEERAKGKGIEDAFVTAYYRGERITVDRAQQLVEEKGRSILEKGVEEGTPGEKRGEDERSKEEGTREAGDRTREDKSDAPRRSDLPEELTAEAISIKVDLGTYEDRVPPEVQKAIESIPQAGIEMRVTESGDTNFRSKAYPNLEEAHLVRHRLDRKGVEEARVITVVEGQRIPRKKAIPILDRAAEKEKEEGKRSEGKDGTKPPERDEDTEASTDTNETTTKVPEEGKPDTSEKAGSSIAPEDIVIRVDLGTYKGNVPNKVARIILNSSGEGISERTTDEGHTNYRTKEYESLKAANEVRRKFVKKGIEKAEIITLVDGKKIPTERAARIIQNAQ